MYRTNELVFMECDTEQFHEILPRYCSNLFCANLMDTLHKDVCKNALSPCAHATMLGFSVVSKNLGKTQTVWTTIFARTRKCHNTSYMSQYISNKMQLYTVYFIWKLLYVFRVVPPPIIRSANNCIWYLSHHYCYLPL
jgi:hypothetical protein